MARAEKNNKNTVVINDENKNRGKLKIIIATLLVIAVITVSVVVIVGSLKKNPAAASDPFTAAAKDSSKASVSDAEVQLLSAVHNTVFGTTALNLNGALSEKKISLSAQYGKDLLSSSVYFSYGESIESLLFDGQYFQYDGGDSVTVAYPAPLLSDSKNIVAGARGDFISLFPDLSTTPEYYNIVGSDVNGSIQTAATLINKKYLDFNTLAELFNKNKIVLAKSFFGTDYQGSVPDFDVLYKTVADFMINGLSADSLTITSKGNGKEATYDFKGNMVKVSEELTAYLKKDKVVKLTLGDDFFNKLIASLEAYVESESADPSSADFSGTVTTSKGFITKATVKDSDGTALVDLTVTDINKAKVSASHLDDITSRADKQTVIKDKDSLLNFLRGKVKV